MGEILGWWWVFFFCLCCLGFFCFCLFVKYLIVFLFVLFLIVFLFVLWVCFFNPRNVFFKFNDKSNSSICILLTLIFQSNL